MNKLFISNKLQELIAFLKKELTKPVEILEPKDYGRPIPKRVNLDRKHNNSTDVSFFDFIHKPNPCHRSDFTYQKESSERPIL